MYEPIVVLVMAYLSYIVAEILGTSAILSVVTCGFNMRHTVEYNMHEKSVTTLHDIIHILANFTEVSIFVWLGAVAARCYFTKCDWLVILWVNLFCLVYRIFSTTFLSWILNRYRDQKITWKDQVIMSIGGLRGGIAFSLIALADIHDDELFNTLLCATISVVFITAFIQGLLIEPIVKVLEVKLEKPPEEKILVTTTLDVIRSSELVLQGIIGVSSQHSRATKHLRNFGKMWRKLYKSNLIFNNFAHENLEHAYRTSWKNQKMKELNNKYDKEGRKYWKKQAFQDEMEQHNVFGINFGFMNEGIDFQDDEEDMDEIFRPTNNRGTRITNRSTARPGTNISHHSYTANVQNQVFSGGMKDLGSVSTMVSTLKNRPLKNQLEIEETYQQTYG